MAPVDFSLVCFRLNPKDMPEKRVNNLNRKLLEAVNKTGKTMLTHTVLKGKYVIRFCIASRTTKEEHVKKTWKLVTTQAEKLL